jgi:4-phytase/acid phosphatase/peptide/nickel transport system substrate-binding protein
MEKLGGRYRRPSGCRGKDKSVKGLLNYFRYFFYVSNTEITLPYNHLYKEIPMWSRSIKKSGLICMFTFAFTIIIFVQTAWTEPNYGGRLRFADEGDSFGFDVIKARGFSAAGQVIGNLVMERLFELGPDNKLIPVLGVSATPSEGGKLWTVKLRQGVRFHDGTAFNADAVVAHWQRVLNPENRFRGRILIAPLKSVEKTAEHEVRFLLTHAWEPFQTMVLTNKRMLTSLIPSPKAVREDIQNRSPVGTGPFAFKEWKTGDRIAVFKNPNYWQDGKPYLDEIVRYQMPDHQTRYMALVSGEVDLIATDRPGHVKKLMDDPEYTTIITDTGGTAILIMNTTKPPLDDPRVRRALSHAWSQEQYIKVVFKDLVDSVEYLNEDTMICDDFGYLKHDLHKAKKLIAEYGKPVELDYFHSRTQRGKETAMVMQQLFKKIGVTLKPSPLAWSAIMKKLFSREFDISSWVIPGHDDMGSIITASFNSKSPWNLMRYNNKTVDELLFQQRMSIDPQVRRQLLCEVARLINADAPFLYLFKQRFYMVSKKKVRGIVPPRNEYIRLSEAWLEK